MRKFLQLFVGIIALALITVSIVAFLTIPIDAASLGWHDGEFNLASPPYWCYCPSDVKLCTCGPPLN